MTEKKKGFDVKKKKDESWDEYLARVNAYLKKKGIAQGQKKQLKDIGDKIIKEAEKPKEPKKPKEDEFEKASKEAKKALSEKEAIEREIGFRLVRKPGESFKNYLKRLKKAKKKRKKKSD